MRDIKFRAWYDNSQTWVYFTIEQTFTAKGLEIYNDLCLQGATQYQYTGLKDKKGTEIYEGNIVLWSGENDNGVLYSHTCVVIFDTKEWNGWALECNTEKGTVPIGVHGANLNELEVIGNIHEHPQLLNNQSSTK